MEKQQSAKKFWIGGTLAVIVIFGGVYFFFTQKGKEELRQALKKPVIVDEVIKIPEIKAVAGTEGWFPNKDAYKVPLVPQNDGDRVVVVGAVVTTRGAYLVALPVAESWGSDAKLVLVKSLGAVTLDGKSAGWQVVFGSKKKKKGYEIIVEKEVITAQKEIPSRVYGASVPANFALRDAVWAITILAENPQFKQATMTGLNFVYNADAKAWDYVIANSFGGSSVRVR